MLIGDILFFLNLFLVELYIECLFGLLVFDYVKIIYNLTRLGVVSAKVLLNPSAKLSIIRLVSLFSSTGNIY